MKYILLLSVFCFGCSSTTMSPNDNDNVGNGGLNNDFSDNGGLKNQGGDYSLEDYYANGTGGSSASGSSTGGSSTGGSSDTCIPKTCKDLTYERTGKVLEDGEVGSVCGVQDDGCGRNLYCNACDGAWHECGGWQNARLNFGTAGSDFSYGEEGICAGGCIQHKEQEYIDLHCSGYATAYSCAVKGGLSPLDYFSKFPPELEGKECEVTSSNSAYGIAYCCK